MAQPVIDTLRLSNALEGVGIERAEAEGAARALCDEFGEHVVARGDLDAGFERVAGEFKDVRAQLREVNARFTEVNAEFKAVRAEMDKGFTELRGGIQSLTTTFRYTMAGIGLMLAFLSAIAGFAVFDRAASHPGPAPQAAWIVVPGATATLATPATATQATATQAVATQGVGDP